MPAMLLGIQRIGFFRIPARDAEHETVFRWGAARVPLQDIQNGGRPAPRC